ncbi:MAG TPA: VOC family protein [Acidimicrobiia bacterium]|nr:VOC family protein [Acidimicrobiia bacterium]
MATNDSTVPNVTWRGVNHLALVTNDMDATVRFYHGVLGARLVATIGHPQFRHYFFQIGSKNTIAFFEYTNAPATPFAKPAGIPDARAAQFDHLSLDVADEEALHALQRRLKAAHCEVTDVVDHGFIRSIYFTDPNGIALEASWWVVDGTAGETDYSDRRLFADADPVAAVRELESDGTLRSLPETHLV